MGGNLLAAIPERNADGFEPPLQAPSPNVGRTLGEGFSEAKGVIDANVAGTVCDCALQRPAPLTA